VDVAHGVFDASFSVDSRGRVTQWNELAEKMFGWTAHEAVGSPLAELIVPATDREAHSRRLAHFATAGQKAAGRRVEVTACRRDRSEIAVEMTTVPAWTGDELSLRALVRDISGRKRAEADLRRLADIVEYSDDAIFGLSPEGMITSWNGGAKRLYGYTAEEMLGESVDRLVPSADVATTRQWRERVVAGEPVDHQQKQRLHKDGTAVDVSITLSAMRDDEGGVVGLSVIARDLSGRNRAERELSEARERFAGAFRNAPIGMALAALDGRFLMVNPALCEFVGRSEQELLGLDFQAISHPDDFAADLSEVHRVLSGEIAAFEMETRFTRPGGEFAWAQASVSIVKDTTGTPLYFIRQMHDVTERKAAEEELRRYAAHLNELAVEDPLTELCNKRGFQAALDRELARLQRHGGALTVALFDIDDFGELNRRRGLDAGDATLRAVAGAIKGACRASDIAARIGPDEFALILPETPGAGALAITKRIKQRIDALEDGVSVSAGVAESPADGDTKQLLLVRADMDLHANRPARVKPPGANGRHAELLSIRRVLELARDELAMDAAFVTELRQGEQVVRAVHGDSASFGLEPGSTLPPDTMTRQLVSVPVYLSEGRPYGTLCCISHSAQRELGERELALMNFLACVVTQQLERHEPRTGTRRAEVEVASIQGLVAALEARDHYTGEHSKRVVELARTVAGALGMNEPQILEVEQVAILHDIGKVGIPDSILQKRRSLTDEEWQLMRQHPVIGARILARSAGLSHLAPAVRAEHERWDGAGYPDALRGAAIPMASRITFACDAYNAMTSDRPYRSAMSSDKALVELKTNAGSQFDPTVVDALVHGIEDPLAATWPTTVNPRHD
jgi:diguanylate cyclase (GGDEF)-like protein/PAS domain S-box-containing protein